MINVSKNGLEVKIFNEISSIELQERINRWLIEEKDSLNAEEDIHITAIHQSESENSITISVWFFYTTGRNFADYCGD